MSVAGVAAAGRRNRIRSDRPSGDINKEIGPHSVPISLFVYIVIVVLYINEY
jgi:hypothetical protein